MGRPFEWRVLELATPMEPDNVAAFLRSVATMGDRPRIVLEAHGNQEGVRWRIGTEPRVMDRLANLLSTHLPESRLGSAAPTTTDVRAGSRIRMPGHRGRPLRQDVTPAISRSVLAALASALGGEAVRLQVILGARVAPRRTPETTEPAKRREIGQSLAEHTFGCCVRIAAMAADTGRARQLVWLVASALRGLEVPDVRVRLRPTSKRAVVEAKSPWLWPLWLSVTDLVPFLGWPVGDLPLPGVAPAHPRLLLPDARLPKQGRRLGLATGSEEPRPVALHTSDSLRHLHVLGPTGTGKSTLLANLALGDMNAGRGVVVVDPKGDLVDDLLARVPKARRDDVVVIDPTEANPVGINPLVGGQADHRADLLLGVLHSLYADSWGPRTQDILHASLLTLARRGDASLVMVPILLTNPGFRRSVVGSAIKSDPVGLGSFWAWYDGISEAERSAAVAPLMNKLRPVLLRPGLRAMLGQRKPKFDVRDVFTKRRILLVSLAKGQIGTEGAALLGSVAVSLFWQAALGRIAVRGAQRHPVMVFIDEVQDYLRLPGNLGDALAQARGLGVGFNLAHQHLDQLPRDIRSAVLANARSRVCFQLAGRDAAIIAKDTTQLVPEDFRALPAFRAYAQLLVDNAPTPWASISTEPLTDATGNGVRLRERSAARYGQPISEVEAGWAAVASQDQGHERLGRAPRETTT